MKRVLLLCLVTCATPVQAESLLLQAGQWNFTVRTTFTSGGPRLGPQEREAMRQMGIDPFNVTLDRCVTPEQARKEFDPAQFSDEASGCRLANLRTSGARHTADYVCDGSLQGKGVFEARLGAGSFTAFTTFAGQSSDAQMGNGPLEMRSDISGRFVKARCD
jgi:hypothetical protein